MLHAVKDLCLCKVWESSTHWKMIEMIISRSDVNLYNKKGGKRLEHLIESLDRLKNQSARKFNPARERIQEIHDPSLSSWRRRGREANN